MEVVHLVCITRSQNFIKLLEFSGFTIFVFLIIFSSQKIKFSTGCILNKKNNG